MLSQRGQSGRASRPTRSSVAVSNDETTARSSARPAAGREHVDGAAARGPPFSSTSRNAPARQGREHVAARRRDPVRCERIRGQLVDPPVHALDPRRVSRRGSPPARRRPPPGRRTRGRRSRGRRARRGTPPIVFSGARRQSPRWASRSVQRSPHPIAEPGRDAEMVRWVERRVLGIGPIEREPRRLDRHRRRGSRCSRGTRGVPSVSIAGAWSPDGQVTAGSAPFASAIRRPDSPRPASARRSARSGSALKSPIDDHRVAAAPPRATRAAPRSARRGSASSGPRWWRWVTAHEHRSALAESATGARWIAPVDARDRAGRRRRRQRLADEERVAVLRPPGPAADGA